MKSFPIIPLITVYRCLSKRTVSLIVGLVAGLALNLLLSSITVPTPLYAAGDNQQSYSQIMPHHHVNLSAVEQETVVQIVTEQEEDSSNEKGGSSDEGDTDDNGKEPGDNSGKCPGKPGDDGKRIESRRVPTMPMVAARVRTSLIQALGPLGFDPQGGRFCG